MNNSWLGLENKVVIVTGGASGIGYTTVKEFLADGAHVVVADMNPNAPVYEHDTGDYIYVRCNVCHRDEVEAVVAKAVEVYGKVDILVNNAGINSPCLLVDPAGKYELNDEIWDRTMNVNVKGLYYFSQAAARVMRQNGSGVIVNVSSECGLEGSEGQSVYAATKAAVNSLTRSWAKELGRYGVRIVAIAPGIIEATGFRTDAYETALAYTRSITVEQLRAGYNKTGTTPLGRSGKLTEIASTIAFLASDRAGYLHGTTVNVAGGKTRG